MTTTAITEDTLRHLQREAEEALLCVVEDALDRPVSALTPMTLKVSTGDNGAEILTVLRFEARIE